MAPMPQHGAGVGSTTMLRSVLPAAAPLHLTTARMATPASTAVPAIPSQRGIGRAAMPFQKSIIPLSPLSGVPSSLALITGAATQPIAGIASAPMIFRTRDMAGIIGGG